MNPPFERNWQVLEFMLALREDQAAGRKRSLREYLERFGDCETGVAREYLLAHAIEDEDEGDAELRDFGPFVLQRVLGQGAEGTVFLAIDSVLGREVALKVLDRGGSDLEEARMMRAANALASLDHDAICQVYSAGREGRRLWISMQYLPGGDLAGWLQTRRSQSDLPSARQLGRLLAPIASALDHAHRRGVLHRDVKPSNIRVDASDRTTLTDFGLAREESDAPDLTATGALRGTPAYMAPELLDGAPSSAAADLWALGVVVFECAVGESPFAAVSTAATLANVRSREPWQHAKFAALDPDLRAVIATALHRDPGRRYLDAEALAADLDNLAAGRPVMARAPSMWRRLRSWSHRQPRLAAFGCAAVAMLVVGLAVTSWLWTREQDRAAREQERADALTTIVTSSAFDTDRRLALAPGNTTLRERIVHESVEALDVLCSHDPTNPRLQSARCAALLRLGDVRGHPGGPNLGDMDAARKCYERVAELAAANVLDARRSKEVLLLVRAKLADLDDDRERAKGVYEEVVAQIDGTDDVMQRVTMRSTYAYARMMLAKCRAHDRDFEAAARELASARAMLVAEGADDECRKLLRQVDAAKIVTLNAAGRRAEAEAHARNMLRECPPDASLARRAFLHRAVANCLMLQGRASESMDLFEQAILLARRGLLAEPHDAYARKILVSTLRSRAMSYRLQEKHDLAAADERAAQELLDAPR